MGVLNIYRVLLGIYPSKVRREFGEEMLQVFGSVVKSRAAHASPAFAFLLLREYSGLLAGAARAWLGVLLPRKIYFVVPIPILSGYLARPNAEEAALSHAEMEERFRVTQASMLEAAERRDFATARSIAPKVARLQLLLRKRARTR